MDDEKDERIQLRKKVKMLEQQILQRTRNYMLSNHKAKIKAYPNSTPGKNQQTQTPIFQICVSSLGSLLQNKKMTSIEERVKQLCTATKKSSFMSSKERAGKVGIQGCQQLVGLFTDIISQILQSINLNSHVQTEKSRGNLDRLGIVLLEELENMNRTEVEGERNGKQKEISEQKFHQMEVMCKFVKDALNQSQQCNYNLRLEIQKLNKELKDCKDRLDEQASLMDRQISNRQTLKNKLDQLEIMKKEYLKAYSKIKLEKQEMEMKMIDLVSEVDKLKQKLSSPQSLKNEQLKIIVEQNDEDLVGQFIRFTGSELSLTSIKQMIQYGLMQEKRSSFEKFVKTALVKLELLDHQLFEQQQKAIVKQKSLENDLHNSYRVIFENIKKVIQREKQEREKMFNETVTKIINYQKQMCRVKEKADKGIAVKEINKKEKDIQESKNVCQISGHQILKEKVNQFHVKYEDLKKKYDNLLSKENFYFQANSLSKCEADLKNFMEKLVQHNEKQEKRLNQQFFEKISSKVFDTLCNLPMANVGQIYFAPATKQQLQDALQAIFKFSVEFGQMEQEKVKMLRKQGSILIKVIEQIMKNNNIGSNSLIQILRANTVEFEIVGEELKSLIKKFIEEQNKKSVIGICQG